MLKKCKLPFRLHPFLSFLAVNLWCQWTLELEVPGLLLQGGPPEDTCAWE